MYSSTLRGLIYGALVAFVSASAVPSTSCADGNGTLTARGCTPNTQRNPPFFDYVESGLEIAQRYLELQSLPELLFVTTFNLGPPSYNLATFKTAGMFFLRKSPASPPRWTKYKMVPGPYWGTWARYPLDREEIDQDTAARKFDLAELKLMKQEVANYHLQQADRRGPWYSIELCRRNPGEPLAYAWLKEAPSASYDQPNYIYDVVSYSGLVSTYSAPRPYCREGLPSAGLFQQNTTGYSDVSSGVLSTSVASATSIASS